MHEIMMFEQYEKDWLRRHRASIPRRKRVSSVGEIFWIIFWTAVAIGAALFSAVHSIPAAAMTIFRDNPNREQLAQTSFMIGELVLFGSAAGRHFIDWLKYLLVASLLVLLVANTSSSIQAVTENGGNVLNQVVGILWSIIAPVTALAAGEVLHTMVNRITEKGRVADAEYEAAMKELNAKINSAYKRYEKEEKERREEEARALAALSALSVRPDTDSRQTRQSSYGYVSTPDGQIKVMAYLDDNPSAVQMGSRALAALIGVSHDTANKGRNAWAAKQNGHTVSSNGTHEQ